MKKSKLLFVVSEDWYFLSHRLHLAIAAQRHFGEVVIACNDTGKFNLIRNHGFRVINLTYTRRGVSIVEDIRLIFKLRKIFKKEKPAIIHNVAFRIVFFSMIAYKSIRIKNAGIINAIMGLGHLYSSSLKAKFARGGVEMLLKKLLSRSRIEIIVQNSDDFKVVTSRLTTLENVNLIKGSGVCLKKYFFINKNITKDRSLPVRLCMLSRLIKQKGIYEYYAASQIVLEKSPKSTIEFHLYGKPDLANPLAIKEEEILRWNQKANFKWHGHAENNLEVFKISDIAVLPSYYGEGIPKCLIEAAACGLPIITTNMPGCREIVKDGINGILVPPRDPQALAQAILKLAQDKELRKNMGTAGRKMVENEFSSERVNRETIMLYQSLLN